MMLHIIGYIFSYALFDLSINSKQQKSLNQDGRLRELNWQEIHHNNRYFRITRTLEYYRIFRDNVTYKYAIELWKVWLCNVCMYSIV